MPDLVNPSADLRCERFGYSCSWSDLDAARFDAVRALAAEVQDVVDAESNPSVGLVRGLERLAAEPVVELIVDREGYTGMFYRLADTPELFATTSLAGPIGDEATLDLSELEAALAELDKSPADAAPAAHGFAGPLPERYHPTGGPRNPKRGLVLDPYATEPFDCPDGTPPDGCLADPTGRVEGSTVYATMNAHPQIDATYRAGTDVGPWAFDDIGNFDLVHIASHGTAGCAGENRGWTGEIDLGGGDDVRTFVERHRNSFASTELDPDRCYAITVLGAFDQAKYDAWRQRVPAGFGMNGHSWAVMPGFLAGKLKSDAIVYISNCASADGQLLGSGAVGAFVGWHSYARTTVAYQAAIDFWRLMVIEGVEFNVATEWLDDEGLDWSFTAQGGVELGEKWIPEQIGLGASTAFMATAGRNLRARDVLTVRLDGDTLDGRILRVYGLPNDGLPEHFPAEGQSLVFELEGVKKGTAGSVVLKVTADGVELEHDLQLQRDGTVVDDGDDWETWRLIVPEGAIELPDTDGSDFDPDAVPIELEVRAYEESSEYTADGGQVRLGARLASNGPLPVFTELAAGLPYGSLTGNDVEIEFDTASGESTGSMRVEMVVNGQAAGYWELDLTGRYDPASGEITGELEGEAQGGLAGITAGDAASGTWSGTVDLDGHTLVATINVAGQLQNYLGTLRAADTT